MFALTVLGFLAATQFAGKSDSVAVKVPFDATKWKLDWSDEFQGDVLDKTKWIYDDGAPANNEAQYYTKDRRENLDLVNGKLVIQALRDNWNGKGITSARITTKGKKSFLYGRIEARAKIPTGRGTWPAVWLLGSVFPSIGWPECGEIDVLENVGFDPTAIHANIHTEAYNHVKHTAKGSTLNIPRPWEEFHTYAVEWYKDRLEFFCDDTRYFVFRKESSDSKVWPFDKPHFLILNLAIGGDWGGQKGIDDTAFAHKFEVDYVRYYVPNRM